MEPSQPLALPAGHDQQLEHARQAQRYFKNRFPTKEEFGAFLRANAGFSFNESSYYECSMAYCAGGPVSEGYSTDVDINAPAWFRQFERTNQGKRMTGRELWAVLQSL